jgi:hypothetical protein
VKLPTSVPPGAHLDKKLRGPLLGERLPVLRDEINTDFHKMFVTDFEVVQRGWFPAGLPAPIRKTIISL